MSEVLERCMKALAQQREQNGAIPYEAYTKHAKEALKEDVETVLKALRELPDEIFEGSEDIHANCHTCGGHKEGWQNIIDEILK